ncbi:uncharacterized protein [Drosophila bipectinata]|uniref:uncharacterized protein isoform X1 n=1 Tax=Drosophila bipectinata TaxID=42026 RepID=UPI0038B3E4C7
MDSLSYSYLIPTVNKTLNEQPKQPEDNELSDSDSFISLGSDGPVFYAPFSLEVDDQTVTSLSKSIFDSLDEDSDFEVKDYIEKMSNQEYAESSKSHVEVKHDPQKNHGLAAGALGDVPRKPKRRGRPPLSPKTKLRRMMEKNRIGMNKMGKPRGRPPITDSIKALRFHNSSGERRRGRPMKPNNLRILQSMSRGNFDFLGPVTQNNGFSRDLILKEIICAFKKNEKLHFLVKFKRCAELEVVTNDEMKKWAPGALIQYYNTHLDTNTAILDSDSD